MVKKQQLITSEMTTHRQRQCIRMDNTLATTTHQKQQLIRNDNSSATATHPYLGSMEGAPTWSADDEEAKRHLIRVFSWRVPY